jgi:MFS family permease
MALSTNSWSIGWIIGPAVGAFVLQKEPLALWPAAATLCVAAGAAGLVLERRLPRSVRKTPEAELKPPSLKAADETTSEGVEAGILG